MDLNEINELSPGEIATLWLSTDPPDISGYNRSILATPATIALGTIIAEGYKICNSSEKIKSVKSVADSFGKEYAYYLSDGGFYVRHDYPIRSFLQQIDDIGFPILPKSLNETGNRPRESLRWGIKLYQSACKSLESKGLIIDPPWYKSKIAAAGLIILLGCVPIEINYKTLKGHELTTTLHYHSTFIDVEKISSPDFNDVHVNLKIAVFVEDVISRIGNSFVESWKATNKMRVSKFERD